MKAAMSLMQTTPRPFDRALMTGYLDTGADVMEVTGRGGGEGGGEDEEWEGACASSPQLPFCPQRRKKKERSSQKLRHESAQVPERRAFAPFAALRFK